MVVSSTISSAFFSVSLGSSFFAFSSSMHLTTGSDSSSALVTAVFALFSAFLVPSEFAVAITWALGEGGGGESFLLFCFCGSFKIEDFGLRCRCCCCCCFAILLMLYWIWISISLCEWVFPRAHLWTWQFYLLWVYLIAHRWLAFHSGSPVTNFAVDIWIHLHGAETVEDKPPNRPGRN